MAKRRRMTEAARRGFHDMAMYWLTCLESWGRKFEAIPATPEELREINAALSYLGLERIDLDCLGDDESESED
jgi:hypothetical protein